MSDSIKMLMNLRSLRAYSRDNLTLEQMKELLEKLTLVVNERIEEDEKAKAERKEAEEKLDFYRQLLKDEGIDPEELLALVDKKTSKTRSVRPPKYKYLDENGSEKTWTGQGRTPKSLQRALDEGANLDDFLIN